MIYVKECFAYVFLQSLYSFSPYISVFNPFSILKDDAVKVLHSICQQVWKTQQWPQDWKMSVFIPTPKEGNAKNAQTTAQLHSSHMLAK